MKKRALVTVLVLVLLAVLALISAASCGDDGGDCPGRICTNCSASGDCNMTCTPPKVNFCGHFGLFDNPNQRCSFCESPDFQF